MPLRLIPPKAGRSPNFRVRGTYCGRYIDRSTGTGSRKTAARIFAKWKDECERQSYSSPGAPTFAGAALTYMNSGGERRFVLHLLTYFGNKPLDSITQEAVDAAALALYPNASAATRNRQVYTPVSCILRRAGVKDGLRRPVGGNGTPRLTWLTPEQAHAFLASAESVNPQFAALCTFLLYTGVRLSEALNLQTADLELSEARAWIRTTKNGEPLTVHLPPVVVARLANLVLDQGSVFGLSKTRRIYRYFGKAAADANIDIPGCVAFHIMRHTYGAWMRRFAGLDTSGLLATKRWKSRAAASVYEHADITEESRRADLLPVGRVKHGR